MNDGENKPRRIFDHEKLDVYQLSLRFLSWTGILLERTECRMSPMAREARDRLTRAALSVVFNTAEGNGRRQPKVKSKFFDDARGSAMESAASLDALVAVKTCKIEEIGEGKEMLVRVVEMLTRLVERFDGQPRQTYRGQACLPES